MNKNTDNTAVKGISLRSLSVIMCTVTVVIAVVLMVVTYLTTESYGKTKNDTHNYISWQGSASDLLSASDYLTYHVRAFSVTGNMDNLDKYFEEANVSRRRDKAFKTIFEDFQGTEAVFYLNNAMSMSTELMNIEYYSMRLVAEAKGYDISKLPEAIQNVVLKEEDKALSPDEKMKLAEEMVINDEYHDYKIAIQNDTQNCISAMAKSTENTINASFSRLNTLMTVQKIMIVLILDVIIIIMIFSASQIISPLLKAVPEINGEQPLSVRGAYEYKFLAKTYNKMFEAHNKQKMALEYEATHDKLTDLYNRAEFDKICASQKLANTALLLIDIDNFKNINDTHGHDAGDKALVHVAEILKRNFRSNDLLFRMGGDEFVVILDSAEKTKLLCRILARKIDKMNEELDKAGSDPKISISAGITFGDGKTPMYDLLKKADNALYEVKNNGKRGAAFA